MRLPAGFDGVEVHGANGYLIEQFLQSHTNLRTDQYGGSVPNRVRFLMEVTQAVVGVWGADRVGVRLSPYGVANGSGEAGSDAALQLCRRAAQPAWSGLSAFHRAALLRRRPRRGQSPERAVGDGAVPSDLERRAGHGRWFHRRSRGCARSGMAMPTRVAFGRIFISNPDLPRRLQRGFPLTPYNRATFYGGDVAGYTDYPEHNELEQA